jgi:Protein of unknown function (DUF2950)
MSQTASIRMRSGGAAAILLVLALPLGTMSCGKSPTKAAAAPQTTFRSPEDAGAALLAAAQSGDQKKLIAIFGPGSQPVLFTGDLNTDRARLNDFVTAYNQMHRWDGIKAGGEALVVGPDNVAFPIPLGKNSSGQWYFDTPAGKDEIVARRIGKDELTAMDATKALAQAEEQYHQEAHGGKVKQYAQKFVSDPGNQNGLYWPVTGGETPSPLGRLGEFATAQISTGDTSNAEFNGYRYRILSMGEPSNGGKDYVADGKMTRGFAILAWPVEYRNSGIVAFLIGPDGVLYQKDLGEHTADQAAALTEYNPGDGWIPTSTHASTASRLQQ